MFLIAVYESRNELRDIIRSQLTTYIYTSNLICKTLWMTRMPSKEKVDVLFPNVQLALLSLDMPDIHAVANVMYHANPDCRIIFYSQTNQDIIPMLFVRPIGFARIAISDGTMRLYQVLSEVIADIRSQGFSFTIENRNGLYIFKAEDIVYLQSDLKNVSIHGRGNEPISFTKKLSEVWSALIEQGLEESFIRLHQSFIVNRAHIRCLDKRNHCVELINGETIPVSDSKYADVRALLVSHK